MVSACADNNVLTKLVISSRSRSGLAWASSSRRKRAGSILTGTVIVWLRSRVLWKVHSKDHPVTVTYISSDTVTGCSYTHCRTQLDRSADDNQVEVEIDVGPAEPTYLA